LSQLRCANIFGYLIHNASSNSLFIYSPYNQLFFKTNLLRFLPYVVTSICLYFNFNFLLNLIALFKLVVSIKFFHNSGFSIGLFTWTEYNVRLFQQRFICEILSSIGPCFLNSQFLGLYPQLNFHTNG